MRLWSSVGARPRRKRARPVHSVRRVRPDQARARLTRPKACRVQIAIRVLRPVFVRAARRGSYRKPVWLSTSWRGGRRFYEPAALPSRGALVQLRAKSDFSREAIHVPSSPEHELVRNTSHLQSDHHRIPPPGFHPPALDDFRECRGFAGSGTAGGLPSPDAYQARHGAGSQTSRRASPRAGHSSRGIMHIARELDSTVLADRGGRMTVKGPDFRSVVLKVCRVTLVPRAICFASPASRHFPRSPAPLVEAMGLEPRDAKCRKPASHD